MSTRMAELAHKKHNLRQRSGALRAQLGVQVRQGVAPLLASTDRVLAAGQWMRRNPAWVVGGAVALMVWRPKPLMQLAGRGLWLWQAWQRVQPVVARLMAQQRAALPQGTEQEKNGA